MNLLLFKMNKLKLSSEELNKISKSSSERKQNQGKGVIYYKNPEELLINFSNSYKFLNNLSNNLEIEDVEISKKILDYIEQFKDINLKIEMFINDVNSDMSFGSHDKLEEINLFINKNKESILEMINVCFPIGRRVTVYDPNEAGGIS